MFETPSLNGLRAFETTARFGSFVEAGKVLGVSSAAVSLQVKRLEEHFEKKLFSRKGNKLELTDAGVALYAPLSNAFKVITKTVQSASAGFSPPAVTVSALPSLCELWLLPRILAFKDRTGYSVEVRAEEDPVDFARNDIDLRITYGSGFYRGHRHVSLFSDRSIPVCTSELWRRCSDPMGTLENVPHALFIHSDWGRRTIAEASWANWRLAAGYEKVRLSHAGLVFNRTSDAIEAAIRGAGVALVSEALAKRYIDSGALVCPSEISIEMAKNYLCIYPLEHEDTEHGRVLMDLLLS